MTRISRSCVWKLLLSSAFAWFILPITSSAEVEISLPPSPTQEVESLVAEVRRETSRFSLGVAVRVAIGSEALRIALRSDDTRPIIASYITSTEFEEALGGAPRPSHVTAVFSNPDPLDQVALAEVLLGRPAVGVFDSPAVRTLSSRLDGAGVRRIPVRQNRDIDALLREAQSLDVIIVLPDANVLNSSNINHVVRTLYQRRSVLIGYSSALTRVGSLASVYGSSKGIAEGVARITEQYADSGVLPEPTFVREISVAFNAQLARSLNISLPDHADVAQAIRLKRQARGRGP